MSKVGLKSITSAFSFSPTIALPELNPDEMLMVKLLVLQQWHGLSDPELEKQAVDRISFRKFIGFPEDIPAFQ